MMSAPRLHDECQDFMMRTFADVFGAAFLFDISNMKGG